MPELTLINIAENVFKALTSSKVIMLFAFEAIILLLALLFSKIMNKKIVKITTILTSLTVFGFYISNYISTVTVFMNNVTTRLMEFLYFPTTLEFIVVMLISFSIMLITLLNKNNKLIIKIINTAVPIAISFLFLGIIEYINDNSIAFDEFSVFTDPTMMSLYELGMGLFLAWIIGLIIYKIDLIIINHSSVKVIGEIKNDDSVIILPKLKESTEIELPKLKAQI